MSLGTLALSAALALTAPAPGSASDTTVVQLGEVRVRGSRPVVAPGGAGAVRARLDSLSLPADASMERVLRALPGAYLRVNSRGEAEVSVRGSESRQVAVLLDGVPLTFAWDGRADLSVIPAHAAEEVTLVRGLSSLLGGPNSVGGVVEFRTRPLDPATEPRRVRLRGGVDQLGGVGFSGSVAAPRDLGWAVFTARAGLGHRNSPAQPLAGNLAEPVPSDRGRRLNTDLREANGFLAFRLDGDSGAFVSLAGSGYEAERGIAAQLGVSSARFWRYPRIARGIGVLSGGTGRHRMPWGGEGDFQLSAGFDRGRTEIDAYDSRAYSAVTSQEDGDDETLTLNTIASQKLGERAELRLGFTYGDIRHDEILSGTRNAYRQRLWSAAGQTTVDLPGAGAVRGFELSAGGTWDGADTPLTGDKPSLGRLDRWGGRLGLAARLGGGATTLHASVSRRARFPSLRELYSGALGTFDPNPGLGPENLLAFETGVTARGGLGTLQILGFHHLLSNAVVRIRPPGSNFRRVNQEGVRSVGVEVLAARALGPLQVSADLIAQEVRVRDEAVGLPRPENMPEVMAALRAEAPLVAGAFVAADVRYTGEQFVIDPETDGEAMLPGAGRLNVEFHRSWPVGGEGGWFSSAQVRAAFENVTNAVQYEAFGLPQPGRSVRLELSLR